ncbi:MAG: hypothetical protein OXB84_01015, partial [Halobacteriovoraceae bacterium]|nr:hypothetical protein [Halobacteriovoraceae bacterium]
MFLSIPTPPIPAVVANPSLFDKMQESSIDSIRYKAASLNLSNWKLFKITGKDGAIFFQGQTTNDLNQVPLHYAQLSARLNRQGRVQGYFYLVKKEDHLLLFILDEVSSLVEDFKQFIIAEDVAIYELKIKTQAILGALSSSLVKDLKTQDYFHLKYQGEDALIYWEENLEILNFPEVSPKDLEILRILNGWPKWNLNINAQSLINDTCLDRLAISYDKGCFLGQETASKIHSRKGAAKFMALLEVTNTKAHLHLAGKFFLIDQKKAGFVYTSCNYKEKTYLEVNLARVYMVIGRIHTLQFEEEQVTAKVCSYPFFKDENNIQKATTLYDRAISYFKNHREEKAMEYLNFAITFNPQFADAYEALGVIHGRRKEYEKAIDLMNKLSQINPNSVMAHANKSLYYMNLGKISEAEE